MNKKVTLREIVATKIIFAILILGYYWMWSRTDWQEYYTTIQTTWGVVLTSFLIMQYYRVKKYKKEGIDEFAEHNLKRCDSICLKILVGIMIVIAYTAGILDHVNAISPSIIGWMIMISILLLSIIRTLIFIIMDVKGV